MARELRRVRSRDEEDSFGPLRKKQCSTVNINMSNSRSEPEVQAETGDERVSSSQKTPDSERTLVEMGDEQATAGGQTPENEATDAEMSEGPISSGPRTPETEETEDTLDEMSDDGSSADSVTSEEWRYVDRLREDGDRLRKEQVHQLGSWIAADARVERRKAEIDAANAPRPAQRQEVEQQSALDGLSLAEKEEKMQQNEIIRANEERRRVNLEAATRRYLFLAAFRRDVSILLRCQRLHRRNE